jgi:hypothetical protein
MNWVALILSLSIGWFLSSGLSATVWSAPRWMRILGEASLAALFGPGLTSVLFFLMTIAGVGRAPAVLLMLAGMLILSAGLWWKLRAVGPQPSPVKRFPWMWVLVATSIAGVLILLLDFQVFSQANPMGEWDASGIWNLRARYLAGGPATWRYAFSADIGGHMAGASHSNYPLFLSSFVALQWVAAGYFDSFAPAASSLLFSIAVLLLLGASLARDASVALGPLAWLVLLASGEFISQASAQYADLLLALAFLASLVLLDRADRFRSPHLLFAAGLAIGLAPWIKNEGWPFACAALAIAAWRFRGRPIVWIILGAMPGLLATIVLKIVSQGREATIPATMGEVLAKLSDPSRWWKTLVGFATAVLGAGPLWAHPLLLMAALAIVLRLVPAAERRARAWLWIPIAATLAAEYGLYLITTADINWHIGTSVNRLVAQVWPSLLWLIFLTLRAPEDYFVAADAAVKSTSKKNRPRA